MAKLTRVPAKVFAASAAADEIGQFGSAVAGSKLETADVATIQGLSAWLSGWSEALVSGNRYPALQEMNGLLKVLSYQGAYALQEGIPEYDSDTTYYIGSIVKKTGTFELYGSLTDDNVGNALTVDTEWQFLIDLNVVRQNIIQVGTSSTAAATTEKEVTLSGFVLTTGVNIQVVFTNSNTATTPTLNVNSTGAKSLKNIRGDVIKYIPSDIKLHFMYDGTDWIALYTNTFTIMPDYSAGISVTYPLTGSRYTAPTDGWYITTFHASSVASRTLYINGTASAYYNGANNSYPSYNTQVVPLSKGDEIYWDGAATTVSTSKFYPCKGGI